MKSEALRIGRGDGEWAGEAKLIDQRVPTTYLNNGEIVKSASS